ncbi:monovalent cation/H+ antiporter subunit A [Neogemmobacter tilapiae]|uniref:Monovalent cation/H+ antiporter subunit A n=1 Tax=Neogemmobacter tilapiae TaxID=875041 RepID=A0A918TGG3_9RHOB|nr:monovalent cation/H+ antiporter subunit A [Gemmobacter tilapiae]GHC47493.1 monovalent cation/H+ antiporter subunit A [Gemmobacter tilapiae]
MTLALVAALPFLGALMPALFPRLGRGPLTLLTASFTALALILVARDIPAVMSGQAPTYAQDWLPALGLSFTLRLDGLALLFALLILGIGLLILTYARFYLCEKDAFAPFLTYLMLFQGAMLGIVLSDNILLLLIFWELTSLSSFLLIGFWKHLPEGRQGARMALAVTGTGGLAMIAGMLILSQIAGSSQISVILTKTAEIQASPLYLPALILILLGAFTKSAQFPFHFWLPQAMAAPTPVSAYLHSATMVKAGIFLMARLWPVLSGTPEWFWLVAGAGLITMLIGAKVAFFQHDLKGLLAYSTVSHLGLITFLLGLGSKAAAIAAVFHIVNHATFKAALFMAAGIVDHEAGTRDIRRLGGLRRLMPVTFALVLIASLSMAGVPPLNGFLSKEMMLEEAAHVSPWVIGLLATLGAGLSVAYSLRLIAHVFLGPDRADYPHPPHDPGPGLWLPPALLVVLVVLIGLAPMAMTGWIVNASAGAVTGQGGDVHISHWHGLHSPALWMSLAAFGLGLMALSLFPRLLALWEGTPKPQGKRIFAHLIGGSARLSQAITALIHNGAQTRALMIALAVLLAAGTWAFSTAPHLPGTRPPLPSEGLALVGWLVLITASFAILRFHRQRLLALILTSVVGLIVSAAFAYLSAPDLALTQLTVEVVTVLLMMLALNFLPKATPREDPIPRHIRDGAIAALTGLGVGALIYALMTRQMAFPSIAEYHLENAKTLGGGTNVVNVILVDFRGYDTFGEITVMGIAALVIYALIDQLLSPGPANDRLQSLRPHEGDAGDRHPLLFVTVTRALLPLALLTGVFIFLRGHNMPGGGFIAGLVVGIAFLMQYMASGFGWTQSRLRIDHHALIGAGVLIAGLTGAGAWAWGLPFLTSHFGYVTLPPLDKFELATAALFDLGVFLTVLGAVQLAIASIARLGIRSGEGRI